MDGRKTDRGNASALTVVSCIGLTTAIADTRSSVPSLSASMRANWRGRRSGGSHPKGESTSGALQTHCVYKSGEKLILGTGSEVVAKGEIRYKTTVLRKLMIVREIRTT